MATVSLVCATKNRPVLVGRRIQLWCKCGVDEVVIVDASEPRGAADIERVSREHGARYVRFPPSRRDTRAKQRNQGARKASGEWILFQDDDDDIISEFDHGQFDHVTQGADYIWEGRGNNVVYHRRLAFLRLGGYPEDMAYSEDVVFSWLARATGEGRLEGKLYTRVEAARERWERKLDVVRRTVNYFWYAFTFLRYLERSPPEQRKNVMLGTFLVPVRLAKGQSPAFALVWGASWAFGFTTGVPWHFLRKVSDREFRENLAHYRQALRDARRADQ